MADLSDEHLSELWREVCDKYDLTRDMVRAFARAAIADDRALNAPQAAPVAYTSMGNLENMRRRALKFAGTADYLYACAEPDGVYDVPLYAAPVAQAERMPVHLRQSVDIVEVGRAHFGQPLPAEWFAAARYLLARVQQPVQPASNGEPDMRPNQTVAQAERAGWQPIETAPKDRNILLGTRPSDDYPAGFVGEGYWISAEDDGPDSMGHDAGFMDLHYSFYRCARSFGAASYQSKGLQPTDWQDLPAAPTPDQTKG